MAKKQKRRAKRVQPLPPLPGFTEGVHFVVKMGKRVPLIKSEDRTCDTCNTYRPARAYYSALHRTCRGCVRSTPLPEGGQGRQPNGVPRTTKPTKLAKRAAAAAAPSAGIELPNGLNDTAGVAAMKRYRERFAPTPGQAELASRILARRRLIHYVTRFNPRYLAGWVHRDIARRLERFTRQVELGQAPRLLLMMPPRHGKSKLTSEEYVSWLLGHHPDWEVISTSYNASLPMAFSRRIRDRLRDPAYKVLFAESVLKDDAQSIEEWGLTKGGGYRAAGVGGGITGKGANVFLVDDPVKNWEEADSVTIRDNTWDWWMSTAYSRLAPGGGVLGIQTWWNDDDWAGRIQQAAKEGGDQYEVVLYPAINETHDEYLAPDGWEILRIPPGMPAPEGSTLLRPVNTALHPERYSLEELLGKKRNYESLGQRRMWSALYQQNPIPEDGEQFTRDMFQYITYQPNPTGMYVFQSWDFAITEKQTSDWTVGYCMALDWEGKIYELDMIRFRSGDNTMIAQAIIDFCQKWKPHRVGVENGQIWKGIKTTVINLAKEKLKTFNYHEMNPLTDKKVRAAPLRGQMQLHRVHMMKDAPWREAVDTELLRFPAGKHDDIVDAAAWTVRTILDHTRPPNPGAEAKRRQKKPASWKDRLTSLGRGTTSHMAS